MIIPEWLSVVGSLCGLISMVWIIIKIIIHRGFGEDE